MAARARPCTAHNRLLSSLTHQRGCCANPPTGIFSSPQKIYVRDSNLGRLCDTVHTPSSGKAPPKKYDSPRDSNSEAETKLFWENKKFCFVFKKHWRNLKRFGFILVSFLKIQTFCFDSWTAWNKQKRSKLGKKCGNSSQSFLLFALKPRCKETFRSDNKLILFHSGLVFEL